MRGQLGAVGLIRPASERRWRIDADEEVRIATPLVVLERGLVDDVAASAHSLFGLTRGPDVVIPLDGHDVASVVDQAVQERRLVLSSALGDQFGVRTRDAV